MKNVYKLAAGCATMLTLAFFGTGAISAGLGYPDYSYEFQKNFSIDGKQFDASDYFFVVLPSDPNAELLLFEHEMREIISQTPNLDVGQLRSYAAFRTTLICEWQDATQSSRRSIDVTTRGNFGILIFGFVEHGTKGQNLEWICTLPIAWGS
ncbi:hypothetical protein [Yoonia sp. SDW83-1]|uniref:hypothetical protein n=1 Tax=Yoonia sp. SDW83-1 TaxID=3366945 RepID=UPI00398C2C41